MAGVVMTGGGVCGLLTAMMLANDGHEVTVLERNPAPPCDPGVAWDEWERQGVTQFRLPHLVGPRFRAELEAELPGVVEALEAAGAHRFNPLGRAAAAVDPEGEFEIVTARRPLLEAVVARVAESTAGVVIRRGTAVEALVCGAEVSDGVPHVVGVRTEAGETVVADLVVDATGRRSPLPRWLTEMGARPIEEEREDSGFVYYGCHVRARDGVQPFPGPSNVYFGSLSLLALPADDGIAGVGLIASSNDAPLRRLRDEGTWRAVVGRLPGGDRILECERVSPMVAMAGLEDRWRRFVVNGRPAASGVLAVADSWAATNPSLGRGITLGLIHGILLRDTVRKVGLDDPEALALAFDEVTERELTPWYRSTVWHDRHRFAHVDAHANGTTAPSDPVWSLFLKLGPVAMSDPVVLPRFLTTVALRETPETVLADPDICERLAAAEIETDAKGGPSRQELLDLIGV